MNLTSENKVLLSPDLKVAFTYSITWIPSKVEFQDRFDKYLDPNFFQHRVSTIKRKENNVSESCNCKPSQTC